MNNINSEIRQHETTVEGWEYKQIADELYKWHDLFNGRFFDNKLRQAVISLDKARVRNLGYYVIGKNGIGVEDNINLNKVYLDRPMWELLRTLLHEMGHQYIEDPKNLRKNNYHCKRFRNMVKDFGIPCDDRGVSIEPPIAPFFSFLNEHGIEVSVHDPMNRQPNIEIEGKSKLKKFSCSCDPPINARVADKRFSAKCNHCGKNFVLSEVSLWQR